MPVIEVNSVWKTFRTHNQLGIKEYLVGHRLPEKEGRFNRRWALKDISFKVDTGRSLGIIGHNGTGKSTLLSMILGTINADHGTIKRKGRIGAMLELGAGSHPELTGRENIFLNGAILGLRIREIKQKYESIVSFSELGSAIDLPLRTYSAGMSARLTFSVLAHAHRDVLLVDEVLTVGDASFQSKCSNYLHDYTAQGGTLIIVSHDLSALEELCVDGILLHEGKLLGHGPIRTILNRYRQSVVKLSEEVET